jgi:hypothetical protein
VRVDTKRKRQGVTWVPAVLELLKQKGLVTSNELAVVMGKVQGGYN